MRTDQKASHDEQISIQRAQTKDVFGLLGTRSDGRRADELEGLRSKYGTNKITETKRESTFIKFVKNFISLMAILLWVGGAVAFFAGTPELGFAIWLVNIINGLFSFFQENKASKATEALKNMLPSYTRVIRDGQEQKILAEELVPGDIMLVEEGDRISADARLVASTDLQINQAALTGESNPVRKNAEPVSDPDVSRLEFKDMIFTGTTVSSGSGKAVVTKIGMATEFGKIAGLTQSMDEDMSPMQKELNKLTRQISVIAISIGIFFFIAAVLFVDEPMAQAFIFSLGMIVAFIPEGLLPTVTLSLAMGVQRMAKEHALVKKLSSVETLGSTSVICSDKTGTLTQNEMTVNDIWLPGQELKVTGSGYAPKGSVLDQGRKVSANENFDLKLLLSAASLCSNARILPPDKQHTRYTVLGDPTEACLGVAAQKAGLTLKDIETEAPRIRELPFDSTRKRMTTIHQLKSPLDGSSRIACVKGAPKETVESCSQIRVHGKVRAITDDDRQKIMAANDRYARNGLRVLAVAYRGLDNAEGLPAALSAYTPELIEKQMTFTGLVVMVDPPRVEVAAAVKKCHEASIRIIMITGDYGLTAESIARRIGIVQGDHPRVVTGIELGKMSDKQLKDALSDEVIFARVAPEQKYRVVTNLQEMNNVVAVTGDGVNDAPALKKADIGVAMGMTGTDVAKESADMILTDDNFASIVHAVEEGRAVFNNIRKFLLYIFNSNTSEAVPSAAFLFSRGGIPLPLTVMQILSIDLGTDMVPALGLGTELPEKGIMNRPPRKMNDSLLNRRILVKAFLWYGMIEAIVAMAAYFFVNLMHSGSLFQLADSGQIYREATTMTLGAIIFCQIGAVINCRTESQSVFSSNPFGNRLINIGIVIEIGLLCLLSYVPFLHGLFNTAPLSWADWLFLILCPIPVVALEEARKAWIRRKDLRRSSE